MSQWLMAPNAATGNASFTNVNQLTKMLDNDLILSSVDRMWNANPFHDIIPVDWTEVVRALRTVWLRSIADPARTVRATVDLNIQMWTSAIQAWNSASARWLGMSGMSTEPGQRAGDSRRCRCEGQSGFGHNFMRGSLRRGPRRGDWYRV